jgi:hypothetical protein
MVLFRGGVGTTWLADTWERDASTWNHRAPATTPPARNYHALAYDLGRGRTVLFGGDNGTVPLADTWEWDGANWTQLFPAQSPPARSRHALACDILRNGKVLFGGLVGGFAVSETWEWDGVSWLQRASASSPPARMFHAMAFDFLRGQTVLFGGGIIGSAPLADTWEWDGTNWLPLTPAQSPPARSFHTLASDFLRGQTVLFGGNGTGGLLGDTWEYGPVVPGAWVPFGTGCAGSSGVPALTAGSELRPYPGNALTVEVAPVPSNAAVLFSLGLSRTQWSGLSLPLLLVNLGMPGCALLASADATLLRFATGSVAALTIPIANNQVFVGLVFYNQAFALDPAANAAGATASNATEARIGSK